MNFLRLYDPLLSTLFEDDDIIAIDKPYGFNAHTNDSKIEHSDFIQDGLIEIYEKNFKIKLHIIHRLDQTTTGVMIFGKSAEAAKKYAQYFFDRQVQKTYWFVTDKKTEKNEFKVNTNIIHKGNDYDALTDFKLINKAAGFELWQAEPHTGRNHQIRIHAEASNISILGDEKYGGTDFPFLCLHNCKIEFPNGLIIESHPPKHFKDLETLKNKKAAEVSFEADRRQRLFSKANQNQCFRLFHEKNKLKDQDFIVDQFGSEKIIQPAENSESKSWTASENEIHYELKADSKNNVGLFTNQRLQRNWVLDHSKDKSVLNLFSYTGSYSVSAAAGGATNITSVDLNKNHLNWSRKNFELNNLNPESYKFLLRDSLTYIEQAATKNLKFDLIISDTPAFYRRDKGVFKIEVELQNLIEKCLGCLNSQGDFLFSTTADDLYIDLIRAAIQLAKKNLNIQNIVLNCILPSLDFELPDQKANLKSFLISLN